MRRATLCLVVAAVWACDDGGDTVDARPDAADLDSAGLEPDAGPDATPDRAVPDAGASPVECDDAAWQAVDGAMLFTCGPARLTLRPVAYVDGDWWRPDCAVDGTGLLCTDGPHALRAEVDDLTLTARLQAGGPVTVEAVGWHGEAELPGATGWLSNGWQSWSMSGAVSIQPEIAEADLLTGIRHTGDREVIRSGRTHSWWHTVTDGRVPLMAGAISARRLKPWLQITGADGRYTIRLVAGLAGERVELSAGDTLDGEAWMATLDPAVNRALDRYADALPRYGGGAVAEAGWNSWYELWDAVDAEAVRANAGIAGPPLTAALPDDAPPVRIVIDDGWQVGWGDWRPNDKFPEGMDGLAAELKDAGFETGIWLAPLLVDADDPLVAEHPEWFVGDDIAFAHLKHGPMRVLDPTHPEAAAHIAGFIERIVGWGYDFLKIDFLFAGTWEGPRHAPVTGLEAYARALEVIRDAAGPDVVLLAVGAPAVAGFDQVDAWRLGPDIAVENFGASWFFVPNEARAIAARWPYCRAVLCDGDPPILRDLPPNEVDVGAWTAAFAGGAWFLSDDLRDLADARLGPGTDPAFVALAIGGEPARPIEPIPPDAPERLASALADHLAMTMNHVVPEVWQLPGGALVRINWTDAPRTIEGVAIPPRTAVAD